jgi:hypothetical protein
MTPVLSTGTAVQVAASTARPAARWTMSAVMEGGVPVRDPHTVRWYCAPCISQRQRRRAALPQQRAARVVVSAVIVAGIESGAA